MERQRDSLGLPGGIEAALMLLWISKVKVTGSHPDVPLYRINPALTVCLGLSLASCTAFLLWKLGLFQLRGEQ